MFMCILKCDLSIKVYISSNIGNQVRPLLARISLSQPSILAGIIVET